MVSRAERTPFGEWWWTVDRLSLAVCGGLMLIGVVMSLAASPPVAARLGLDPFHFVNRQILFTIPAVVVMFGISLLTPRQVRRLALVVFIISLAMVAVTPIFAMEIKGAKRWLVIFGVNIQPSEFLKPSFVIIIAWLFGESTRRPEMPSTLMAFLLVCLVMALLIIQPDFGQTMLILGVWSALFFMAGMRIIWVFGLGAAGLAGGLVAYSLVPHFAKRINRFMDPSSGDTFNIDLATESFVRGGWLGRGPGEGTVKRMLPESHTDFVFAVTAEEFGIAFCMVLVLLFSFIVVRSLLRARNHDEPFLRFAGAGLAMLFGLQSAINMSVNLHLIPAKGMTLPFVSYGGSSLIAMAYGMGMLIALTREQPRAAMITPHLSPEVPPDLVSMSA